MARTKLDQEIKHYLGLPYFINKPIRHLSQNALVGKGTWQEISAEAQKLNPDFNNLSPEHKYNFLKKHHLGIDCSGLVYHLLNRLCFVNQLFPDIQHVSADILTNHQNSHKITSYDQIKPADLIRTHRGHHVIFIVKKTGRTIHYIHSSDRTQTRGVHLGTITITDPKKSLIQQSWSEKIPHLSPATLHRLKCLS